MMVGLLHLPQDVGCLTLSLRLFDEKSPRYNEFLSTEASLKLRQRSVRGGGSVSAANIANHIHMLADKFDGSFVEGLIDTVKTMLDGWLSPDQWAIDLVESMPFYESDFDMFGRKWQPSLLPSFRKRGGGCTLKHNSKCWER